jgi:hypothetical protein
MNSSTSLLNDSSNNELVDWKNRPEVWSDDVRMKALFAPFRSRDYNPLHYDAKLKFWKESIISYLNDCQIMQFDMETLERAFKRNNLCPKCLELPLEELIKDKKLQTYQDLFKNKTGNILTNVFSHYIWPSIVWPANYLFNKKTTTQNVKATTTILSSPDKSSISSPTTTPTSTQTQTKQFESLIFIDLLETKSFQLLKLMQNEVIHRNVDCLIDYETIVQQIIPNSASKELAFDVDILLNYLQTKKLLIIDSTLIDNKILIKFSMNSHQNGAVEEPTQLELCYCKLKESEKVLENQIKKYQEQIDRIIDDVKSNLRQNNKINAMKLLKKKKSLEKLIEQKDSTVANIQTMLISIHQIDTNKITSDVYNKSLEALREANKDINIDKIDDTLCDIQDILLSHKQITDVLNQSKTIFNNNSFINNDNNDNNDSEDDELERELNDLLNDSTTNNIENLLDNLKDINNTSNSSFNMEDLKSSLPQIDNSNDKRKKVTSD